MFILTITCLLFLIYRGNGELVIELNVHDSYFVVTPKDGLLEIGIITLFTVYLIRAIIGKFKNSFVNVVFLIANAMLLFDTMVWEGTFAEMAVFPGTMVYPPLSSGPQEIEGNIFAALYEVLFWVQLSLSVLLTFVAFRLGKTMRTSI